MTQDQNWTIGPDGGHSQEYVRITKVIADLLESDHHNLSVDPDRTARQIVGRLAHEQQYTPEGYHGVDWTMDPVTHRTNESETFETCVMYVLRVLRIWDDLLLQHKQQQYAAEKIVELLVEKVNLTPPAAATT